MYNWTLKLYCISLEYLRHWQTGKFFDSGQLAKGAFDTISKICDEAISENN